MFLTIFLAYANGANDNFKGVATLWGSGTADYKKALWWATITTLLGSLTAVLISARLVTAFSGKGLIPDTILIKPYFLISVGIGAALTVFIATLTGIPISTTHGLTGALIGAGLVTVGSRMNFSILGNKFFMPLLISPLISAFLTLIIYPCFKFARVRLGIERQMCLCVGKQVESVCLQQDGTAVLKSTGLALRVDQIKNCQQYYQGRILGFDSQGILDRLHYISAGAVSFARGLNDTPKIIAILLVTNAFSLRWAVFTVAFAMLTGGLLNAKRVALTMSKNITKINHGQGFSANLVTAFLVIFASRWGLPVSTTHVSCGSLFGIGFVNKKANFKLISEIVLCWILTLPLAAAISAVCALFFKFFIR